MKELEAISRKIEEWRELGPVARNGLQCADELSALLPALEKALDAFEAILRIDAKQEVLDALKESSSLAVREAGEYLQKHLDGVRAEIALKREKRGGE